MQVYDHRNDVRNVLVTPQIRARFMQMQPGQVALHHSHDLGHEVFLVLEGQCEFEIDGDAQVLGPGQMCIALADQIHSLRVVGDEPMTLYLSVTPHIQPTHTTWETEGRKAPPRFSPSSAYNVQPDQTAVEELIERHIEATQALAEAAQKSAQIQREMGAKLTKALIEGEEQSAIEARNVMWEAIYKVHRQLYESGDAWNALAPRATEVT